MSRFASISGASRYSKATLNKVYKRGLGAYYSSGSRPKVSAHQWAMGRVKSFVSDEVLPKEHLFHEQIKVGSERWNH